MPNDKTSVSNAASYEEIGEFWDAHDLGAHWDATREATFEIAIEETNGRAYFPVESEMVASLRAAAQRHGISPEALVKGWLQERLAQEVSA